MWKAHLLTNSACNETPIYVDLFKTGKKHLVMGWNPQKDEKDIKKGNYDDRGELCYFVPGKDPTQPWTRVSISGPSSKGKTIPGTARFAHGLGHGDINGDGRLDVIVPQGWWEQPVSLDSTPWKFHAGKITDNCADMYTIDIDGDGKADVVSTSAHNYGFWWSQQKALNTFLQRPLFLPPSEVAKLPKETGLSADETALLGAINKIRTSTFKAPWKLNAKLTAEAKQNNQDKLLPYGETLIPGSYRARYVYVMDNLTMPEIAAKFFASFKSGTVINPPHLEIGIAVTKSAAGKLICTILIDDVGSFSLPSQTHALNHVDIDGDGVKDLVTGRRWWAHGPKGDAGPNDPAYLYWFQTKVGKDGIVSFIPHEIDDDSGIGTQFAIADMNGDGVPDIIISNKRGVFVIMQIRAKE